MSQRGLHDHCSPASSLVGVARLSIGCLAALLCTRPCTAQQASSPGDAAARSAYCIPIVQGNVESGKQLDLQLAADLKAAGSGQARDLLKRAREAVIKSTTESEQVLAQLQASLPASQSDAPALSAAKQRGETDRLKNQTESKACSDRCSASARNSSSRMIACMHSCGDPELQARVKACEKPDWLPNAPRPAPPP